MGRVSLCYMPLLPPDPMADAVDVHLRSLHSLPTVPVDSRFETGTLPRLAVLLPDPILREDVRATGIRQVQKRRDAKDRRSVAYFHLGHGDGGEFPPDQIRHHCYLPSRLLGERGVEKLCKMLLSLCGGRGTRRPLVRGE